MLQSATAAYLDSGRVTLESLVPSSESQVAIQMNARAEENRRLKVSSLTAEPGSIGGGVFGSAAVYGKYRRVQAKHLLTWVPTGPEVVPLLEFVHGE
jgi:hypothetical protein